MTDRYYAIDVAAVKTAQIGTGVPARTIRRWITEGRLTSMMTNGVYYVRLSEVEQLRDLRDTRGYLRPKRLPKAVP